MKCPHCDYKDGWDPETSGIEGIQGEFYQLKHATMIRSKFYEEEEVSLFGCPACMKTFIEKVW